MLDIYDDIEVLETRLQDFVALVDEWYTDTNGVCYSHIIHDVYSATYVGLLAEFTPAEALEILLAWHDPSNSL